MSNGSLPPVPDLIPIAALLKKSSGSLPAEVMGEQRPRRTGSQPPVDLIDNTRSRGPSAAPQAPQSRKARSERHRKSDRRRKPVRNRSASKHSSQTPTSSPERPANPRVNPIFVWVRQEDTRIVDVKCEDYDKRNRILLTKTAQGWRAIPRTETLVPTLKEADSHHHHHHHKNRKSRKGNKVKRKSTAVQVDSDIQDLDDDRPSSPTWTSPVNVESHLPSHKIQRCPSPSVNSAVEDSAQDQDEECSAAKLCDVSPLDNLLAVAEFEFNQHMQSGKWNNKTSEHDDASVKPTSDDIYIMNNMEELIESCTRIEDKLTTFDAEEPKEDCDYNEDDDNNIAMDDILSRLEQSLQSPEYTDPPKEAECCPTDEQKDSDASVNPKEAEDIVESSTTVEDEPTDLSIKPLRNDNECNSSELPTDLTLPRNAEARPSTPRSPSQNSEAIQSPQPSGIPAVPPSPDIVSSTNTNSKKSFFVDSSSQKVVASEPLDLGKSRKSASPTVTCSEEVKNNTEPPLKKLKFDSLEKSGEAKKSDGPETPRLLELLKTDSEPDPLTQLRQLLCDPGFNVPDPMLVPKEKLSQIISHPSREIPRLLKQRPELRLPEALAFPHLLQDPDILVITLQQLETIILKQNQSFSLNKGKKDEHKQENPAKNLKTLNLLHDIQPKTSFNELASDIDAATTAAFNQMLWLPYLNQLEAMSFGNNPEMMKMLANTMPLYPGQLPDVSHVMGANRLSQPMAFPVQQPAMNYNSLEMSMWQEAMQASMIRPKLPFEGLNPKASFRNYLDKLNFPRSPNLGNQKLPDKTNFSKYYPSSGNNGHSSFQNSFIGVPSNYPSNSKQNLQIPQYNSLFNQKNLMNQSKSQPYHHQQKAAYSNYQQKVEEFKNLPHQKQEYKSKLSSKPFANASYQKHHHHGDHREKSCVNGDFSKPHTQPIDLSGSTAPTNSKLKVKQHLTDPVNPPKLLRHEDIPEVGSTTASVEEMQDAQKHLWHPYFGNQKGYHNPWNWTTVTATGE